MLGPDADEDAGGCLVLDEVQPHREQERHEAGEDERQFQAERVGQVLHVGGTFHQHDAKSISFGPIYSASV